MPTNKNTNARLLLCSSDHKKTTPLRQQLESRGLTIDCVTTADDARALLWEYHYTGIAIDLLLADRDGISFAMELRQEHPWMPILVISTTATNQTDKAEPDRLTQSSEYARLVFALKQASQRAAGRPPSILHLESNDDLAQLVHNTIGQQTRLFRARSKHEAQIAMAVREYDLALVGADQLHSIALPQANPVDPAKRPLCIDTGSGWESVLAILGNLRSTGYVHKPAYC